MADWNQIKTEYITTNTSYRKLSDKYGVSFQAICHRSKEEGWIEQRELFMNKTVSKTIEKIREKQVERFSRIDSLAEQILKKLEQAVSELDVQLAKHTEKTKVIEYGNQKRADKPTKETVHEEEKLIEYKTIIDRVGLKQVASALRDLKEVQMVRTELDNQEQQARIDKLHRDAQREDTQTNLVVTIAGGGENWEK